MINLSEINASLISGIEDYKGILRTGKLNKLIGLVLESTGPAATIGEICILVDKNGQEVCKSEVVGFKDSSTILSMVLGDTDKIYPGMEIIATGEKLSIDVGERLLGRIIDGLGEPIDGNGHILTEQSRSLYASPPNPLKRQRIIEPITTGIRAIDSMLTIGRGQRVGIFAGSGVGKSTLIGMIARNTNADVNVIALIGERGREVKEFIEKDLGEEGLRRSVLVVSTSDAPPLIRVKATLVATTIAEYFRDKGLDVMLMMDSVTRMSMAQREVGLTIGEPPTSRGYTPSVFSLMQKTMERAGTGVTGSITGLYTVLVEGDDMNEPIADTSRGILDGHIILSRKLANKGHYPSIDVSDSVSRVMTDIISEEHKIAAKKLQRLIALYNNSEDLINVGAYKEGSNPELDSAIRKIDEINKFLNQDVHEFLSFEEIVNSLIELAKK